MTDNNAPGTSPIYAAARDMLDALGKGLGSIATVPYGTLYVTLQDGGDYRALMLCDVDPLHPDTLALWAAAFGQPADGWRVDSVTGRRVARLEWATDGEAAEGGRVTWMGGKNHG
jgi:hypothetical protein